MKPAKVRPGNKALAHGAWHFKGPSFSDARGNSHEAFDRAGLTAVGLSFDPALENILHSTVAGTLRGLHYQVAPLGQKKLVYVLQGRAQFFWLKVSKCAQGGPVPSIILSPGDGLLYTPADCVHGVVTLEPGTVFSLKLGAPISLAAQREISFRSPSLTFDFAVQPRWDLLSLRDRRAPESP